MSDDRERRAQRRDCGLLPEARDRRFAVAVAGSLAGGGDPQPGSWRPQEREFREDQLSRAAWIWADCSRAPPAPEFARPDCQSFFYVAAAESRQSVQGDGWQSESSNKHDCRLL